MAEHLLELGHDAQHVRQVGLAGATDAETLAHAALESRVVVTENAVDFVPLLDAGVAAEDVVPSVVLALKANLPTTAGAMAHELARRLARWAEEHPDPYPHVHWLGSESSSKGPTTGDGHDSGRQMGE